MLLCRLCQHLKKRLLLKKESGFSQKRACSSGLKQGDQECPIVPEGLSIHVVCKGLEGHEGVDESPKYNGYLKFKVFLFEEESGLRSSFYILSPDQMTFNHMTNINHMTIS